MMGFSSLLFLPNPESEPDTAAGVYLAVGPLAAIWGFIWGGPSYTVWFVQRGQAQGTSLPKRFHAHHYYV